MVQEARFLLGEHHDSTRRLSETFEHRPERTPVRAAAQFASSRRHTRSYSGGRGWLGDLGATRVHLHELVERSPELAVGGGAESFAVRGLDSLVDLSCEALPCDLGG